MAKRPTSKETEERAAWAAYLRATVKLIDPKYEEVEPWAWKRLERRLNRLKAKPDTAAAAQ